MGSRYRIFRLKTIANVDRGDRNSLTASQPPNKAGLNISSKHSKQIIKKID